MAASGGGARGGASAAGGGARDRGLSALFKETPAPQPHRASGSFHHVGVRGEVGSFEERSPQNPSPPAPRSPLPASRSVSSEPLCFPEPPRCGVRLCGGQMRRRGRGALFARLRVSVELDARGPRLEGVRVERRAGRAGVAGWPGHAPRGALGQRGRPRVRFSPAAEKSLVFGEVQSGVLPGVETRQVRLSR